MTEVYLVAAYLCIIVPVLGWATVVLRKAGRDIDKIIDQEVKRDDDEGPPR